MSFFYLRLVSCSLELYFLPEMKYQLASFATLLTLIGCWCMQFNQLSCNPCTSTARNESGAVSPSATLKRTLQCVNKCVACLYCNLGLCLCKIRLYNMHCISELTSHLKDTTEVAGFHRGHISCIV